MKYFHNNWYIYNDTFEYESYYSLVAKRLMIIWDYKDKKGILHSGVTKSLGEAIEKAKTYGYQSNEIFESKSQHCLVRKSYIHKALDGIKRETRYKILISLKALGLTIVLIILVLALFLFLVWMYYVPKGL